MLINTAPQNEAVLSNVGEQGEFRIRNSAKAFSILSSGLYANKIRAIIRELSTNARDSHTDAGKAKVPFDVHLPTDLEPWFSIRDYGTGLSHEQVVNIYTTYFESTKTNSNDFVGCLGLGSKSPFAVTENFTVTAIKDGIKGIYTAFINDNGVPSIARMSHGVSDEPSGVEVKFAVEDSRDFYKYREEALNVYQWFDVKPVFSGATVNIRNLEYNSRNIIPGVHNLKNSRSSFAIMGGIAYPIDVPNAKEVLGPLQSILACGMVMHFEIGELDFQASREGLSYIPQTISAIKNKLEAVNAVLSKKLSSELDAIECVWAKTHALLEYVNMPLWHSAAEEYVKTGKISTVQYAPGTYYHLRPNNFTLKIDELASKYNVEIRAVQISGMNATTILPETDVEYVGTNRILHKSWKIRPDRRFHFVKNDTKVGAVERVKYHYRKNRESATVYVLSAVDKSKPAMMDEVLAVLLNPPTVKLASTLEKKVREAAECRKISILRLEPKYNDYRSRYNNDMVWREVAGGVASVGTSKTYYLPLSGYALESKYGYIDSKELVDLIHVANLQKDTEVYGVRKSDIKTIETQKNWVNLEEHIKGILSDHKRRQAWAIESAINNLKFEIPKTNISISNLVAEKNADSDYVKLAEFLKNTNDSSPEIIHAINRLCKRYGVAEIGNTPEFAELTALVTSVNSKYPMLKLLESYIVARFETTVADYIIMCDSQSA